MKHLNAVLSVRMTKDELDEIDALAKELGTTRTRLMHIAVEFMTNQARHSVNNNRQVQGLPSWDEHWSGRSDD